MAYHSEVLQQERDLLRRTHLLPPSETFAESGERGTTSLRRAGGSGHPLFTAMAEAALAQVNRPGWSVVIHFIPFPEEQYSSRTRKAKNP